MLESSKVYK